MNRSGRFAIRAKYFVDATADGFLAVDCGMEGRRQIREMMDILREEDPCGAGLSLVALSAMTGIRDARQIRCSYQVREEDFLYGRHFEAAGVACYEALNSGRPAQEIDFNSFREKMKAGGSIVL